MTAPDPSRLRDTVTALADRAGRAILDIYERGFHVTRKADASPVTEADMAAHALITTELERLTPGIPVLSEEGADVAPWAVRRAWRTFWLVDPLDGTKEFVHGNGEFTVNIALVDDGFPILGVLHVPVTGVTYSAAAGVAAERRDRDGTAEAIRVFGAPGRPLRVVVSRSHSTAATLRFLDGLRREHGEIQVVKRGSALKACLVAEGLADLYPRLEPTMEWDTAAVQCVVEQAGARLVDLDGRRFRYNKESLRNPSFMVCAGDPAPFLALLREAASGDGAAQDRLER